MKRILLLGLALCVCVGLMACTATDKNNLFGESTKQEGLVLGRVSADESYQYGNMQEAYSAGELKEEE